jgi:hypothetical protein
MFSIAGNSNRRADGAKRNLRSILNLSLFHRNFPKNLIYLLSRGADCLYSRAVTFAKKLFTGGKRYGD